MSSLVHGSSGPKAIRKFNIVRVRKKKQEATKKKRGGGKRAVQRRAISRLPPRRGGAPTPVFSPARRSAAVPRVRGGTARPPEAEWSSEVVAFLRGCYNQDIFKDPKKRHYHGVIRVWGNPGSTRNVQLLLFLSFVAWRTRQVGVRFDGEPSDGNDRSASRQREVIRRQNRESTVIICQRET